MSSSARIGILVAAVVALVVAFVVLSPGGGDDEPSAPTATATTPTPTTTTITGTATEPTARRPQAQPAPQPAFVRIRVRAGKPVGGVKEITARKGDRVRVEVTSPDTSDEVHLHGYDVSRDLEAGGGVRFSFEADAEGIFELELEGSHTQIAKIEVRPR